MGIRTAVSSLPAALVSLRHLWSFKDELRFLKRSLDEAPLNNAPLALRVSSKIALLPRGPIPKSGYPHPEVTDNDVDQMLQRARVRHLETRGINTHANLTI